MHVHAVRHHTRKSKILNSAFPLPQIGFIAALPGSKQCKICPAGTISVRIDDPDLFDSYGDLVDLNGMTGADTCYPCPAGYFQSTVGGSSCLPCPFGTYALSTGSKNCTRCAPGTASSETALTTACPSCPTNFYAKYDNFKSCM